MQASNQTIKLALLGTRGVPARYGGFETFVENLAPILAKSFNFDVTIIGDNSQNSEKNYWGAVRLVSSKYSKGINPLRFYWDSLSIASDFADIALICGAPGGALAFRARKKMFIVTNPDGIESKRQKWSRITRSLFFAAERASSFFSHALSCDSPVIESYFSERHKAKKTFVSEYGALENPFIRLSQAELAQHLSEFGLHPKKYHLVVARFEPENQIKLIADAYALAGKNLKYPLFIISNLPETKYAKKVMQSSPPGVAFHGPLFLGESLQAIRAGALSYIHGHSVGGTNPSLVEALAAKNICICDNNPFNKTTTDGKALFFSSAGELAKQLVEVEGNSQQYVSLTESALKNWKENYTWEKIADKYALNLRSIYSSNRPL